MLLIWLNMKKVAYKGCPQNDLNLRVVYSTCTLAFIPIRRIRYNSKQTSIYLNLREIGSTIIVFIMIN